MRKILLTVAAMCLAAIAFVACDQKKEDAVMVVLKMEDGNYWLQVASAIDRECAAQNVKAVIRYTTSDADYQSQLNALDEMVEHDYNYKGIIAVPIYSEGNHQVETRIAGLAEELNIPVIILDTPVKESESPLAGKYRTFVGTDNVEAGKLLGEQIDVPAENILSVRSKASNAGQLRYDGFTSVVGTTSLWETTEAEAANLDQKAEEYPEASCIVCFNGSMSCYADVLVTLEENGKEVYTFDVYKANLESLLEGGVVKGILAQNTFEMGKQAVDAVFNASVKNPFYIAPVYLSQEDADSDVLKPYIEFYK